MLSLRCKIATAVAILFHAVGLVGILFFDRQFFISSTPYHLTLMFLLLLFTQEKINVAFILFCVTCFAVGMMAEIQGTSTGALFGEYIYGSFMGPGYKNVPFVIGLNWIVIIYCCGITVSMVLEKLSRRLAEMTGGPTPALRMFSMISDGAMLCVFFDWIMEPAANKLGYWTWLGNGSIPFYNYLCWFIISAVLLVVFSSLKFSKRNIFAVNLLLIMMMFFMLIRTFA